MGITSLWSTAWSRLLAVWAFAADHPGATTYVVGTLFALIFKPKTEEQYARIASRNPAWFYARWAAFLQLTGTIFSDVAKAQAILLQKILKGPPKPPPQGPSLVPSSLPPPPPDVAARSALHARKPRSSGVFRMTFATLLMGVLFVSGATLDSGCAHPAVPSPATLEAGANGVEGICTLLEGVTENQTVISVCATVEEIAWMVATFMPFFASSADGGTCMALECASPAQKGTMIQGLLGHRRARLFLDAGTR